MQNSDILQLHKIRHIVLSAALDFEPLLIAAINISFYNCEGLAILQK